MKKFLKAVRKVRMDYPGLWATTKRNRRVETYYWLGHGVSKTYLLK